MSYRWKGKIVKKTIYERNLKLSLIGKSNKKSASVATNEKNNQQKSIDNNSKDDGNSVVRKPFDVRKISIIKKRFFDLPIRRSKDASVAAKISSSVKKTHETKDAAAKTCLVEKNHESSVVPKKSLPQGEESGAPEDGSIVEEKKSVEEDTCPNEEMCTMQDETTKPDDASDNDEFPVEGNRIVDLEWLSKRMTCDFCKDDLLLKYTEREVRRGFGSFLYIRCKECLLLNKISTGRQHFSNESGRRLFNVNTKSVLGALHTGLRHAHLKKFMQAIDVPSISASLFTSRKNEIHKVFDEIDLQSCANDESESSR